MKKQNAFKAWNLLILSLPKGIIAFVVAIAGICVSLPLAILWIGLPMLALTFALCRGFMDQEEQQVSRWMRGSDPKHSITNHPAALKSEGSSFFSLLKEGRSYRSILYSLVQLPIGIAAFTIAVVLPITAFAVMLAPLAYKISESFFSYELDAFEWVNYPLFTELTSYERSWVAAGVGLVLVLLLPLILRGFGRLYAAWIQAVSHA